MQFVETTAGSIHVSDQGPKDGDVVVLANSLGTDLRVWDKIAALLPPAPPPR